MAEILDITTSYLLHANYRPVIAGDDYTINFTAYQDSVAIDLTGAKIWFTIKKSSAILDPGSLQYSTDDTDQIEVTSPTEGKFSIYLGAADTAPLAGTWEYDIKVKLNTTEIKRLAIGKIEFMESITTASS
jgi:hypothetical protein